MNQYATSKIRIISNTFKKINKKDAVGWWGLAVSMLALNIDYPSSNPSEVYIFYSVKRGQE